MTKCLHSLWQDDRIESVNLSLLTPMDLHVDDRYLTRDLPRIKQDGLWYPILIYRVPLSWWNGPYQTWRPKGVRYVEPVILDNTVLAIKIGCNRFQCALKLGYTHIDAILCNNSDECVKIGRWYAQCDPLHNPSGLPYMDIFCYEELLDKVNND